MDNKCSYCGKTFKNEHGLKTHIGQHCEVARIEKRKEGKPYKCLLCGKSFKSENSLHGHKGKCTLWREYIKSQREKILTKEFLIDSLLIKKQSAKHVADNLNSDIIDARNVIEAAKNFNIKTMNIKEAAANTNTRDKYRKTCLKKYGKDNALSRGTVSYKKRNKTIKDKYGVQNVFQLDVVKEKSKNTLQRKYGVTRPIDLPWRKNNNGRKSKEHKIIEDFLNNNNICFESEVNNKFKKFNNFYKKYYSPIPDVLIENKKLIIEVNGDYWHANPNKYKPNDTIKRFKGSITAKEIWQKDLERKKHLESFGYKVIYIWTSEIKSGDFSKICKELKLKTYQR